MSPGNSYFNEVNIKFILNSLLGEHKEVLIMIADIPAISTYIALGYPENRARTDKAVRNSNNIKNKVLKVMSENDINRSKIRILDWNTEVENNSDYREKYSEVRELYNNNHEFRKVCNQTTQKVLEGFPHHIEDMDRSVTVAVHYLLAELAFLEFANKFLNQRHVTYVYHNNWPVFEEYIAGAFDGKDRRDYLGFKILKNSETTSVE